MTGARRRKAKQKPGRLLGIGGPAEPEPAGPVGVSAPARVRKSSGRPFEQSAGGRRIAERIEAGNL